MAEPYPLNEESLQSLVQAYVEVDSWLPDPIRGTEGLAAMVGSGASMWALHGGVVAIFWGAMPEVGIANVTFFSVKPMAYRDNVSIVTDLQDAMEKAGLEKLHCMVPLGGSSDRLCEMLGFMREGELRRGVLYGGRIVDGALYGLLRSDVVAPKKTTRPNGEDETVSHDTSLDLIRLAFPKAK